MRADRHPKLGGQQEHGQDLVQATEPAGVHLAVANRLGLEELFEDHAVLAVLARRDLDRGNGAGDGGVAEHIVWARRLLDPVGPELGEALDVGDRVPHLPHLVGVHHQPPVGTDLLTHDPRPADVVLDPLPHLDLDVRPSRRHRLAAQGPHLLIRVAEPARRGRVGGIA